MSKFRCAGKQFIVSETKVNHFARVVVGQPALQQIGVDFRVELQCERTAEHERL